MTNPFEDEDGTYLVLRNDEAQYALWPGHLGIPEGWTAVYGPDSRPACVGYVEEHWTDMRPKSLATFMEQR